ncbi:heavy metal-associated isoprenylated plant protein 4 [Humulus lupulus]|uniref:heavy metal-associated isoprenylated plant protein 4 n=1 Tax=Humulus lupulus TaxID=3486 RepID=UPI002B40FA6E|nr:heavy metal-associated isoprenylated plant protein 4 [Humulus lupulus]
MATTDVGVITGVYKTNLHCPQCALDIKRPLLCTQGIHNVETDMEKCEIWVKGSFDPIKIQKRIQKLCKKKVELILPKVQIKETSLVEKKVIKETKQPDLRTTSVKVHLHCDQCARDLEKKLIRQKGIQSVKADMKTQILRVEGSVEGEKLVSFLRKKVHKHAEIIVPKNIEEKKVEIKEEKVVKEKQGITTTYDLVKKVEIKEQVKVVEAKSKEGNAPYFIHYVYAPQHFSDENPNACTIS